MKHFRTDTTKDASAVQRQTAARDSPRMKAHLSALMSIMILSGPASAEAPTQLLRDTVGRKCMVTILYADTAWYATNKAQATEICSCAVEGAMATGFGDKHLAPSLFPKQVRGLNESGQRLVNALTRGCSARLLGENGPNLTIKRSSTEQKW